MTKAKFIRTVRRYLTSEEDGAGLDAATAGRAISELESLPDWVFNLRALEIDIDRRATIAEKISKRLIARLDGALLCAQQLKKFDIGVGIELAQSIEQLQVKAMGTVKRGAVGRKTKMAPVHVALAMYGALHRAGLSNSICFAVLRACLPLVLGLSAAEVETALKKARPAMHGAGIK